MKLALFFTRGISLEIWLKKGLFDREKRLYEEHLIRGNLGAVYWLTYGTKDAVLAKQLHDAGRLDQRIEVYEKPSWLFGKIGDLMYSFLMPIVRCSVLKKTNILKIELSSKNRRQKKTIMLNVSDQKPANTVWPQTRSRILENNIGYLRITNWLRNIVEDIKNQMDQFRGTKGLIIDVRDNSGGTRNILRTLYPYFCESSDPPIVANAAKYRLYREFGSGYLDSRHMYPQQTSVASTAL